MQIVKPNRGVTPNNILKPLESRIILKKFIFKILESN